VVDDDDDDDVGSSAEMAAAGVEASGVVGVPALLVLSSRRRGGQRARQAVDGDKNEDDDDDEEEKAVGGGKMVRTRRGDEEEEGGGKKDRDVVESCLRRRRTTVRWVMRRWPHVGRGIAATAVVEVVAVIRALLASAQLSLYAPNGFARLPHYNVIKDFKEINKCKSAVYQAPAKTVAGTHGGGRRRPHQRGAASAGRALHHS
jgi:hypothetical protein